MKQLYTFIILFLFIKANIFGQIATFPYVQSFEEPLLATGENVEFLPFWTGNDVRNTSSRIFITSSSFSGEKALAVQPISSFSGQIRIQANVQKLPYPILEFYAYSMRNGTGSRPAMVNVSFSTDHGISFFAHQPIGDQNTFPNDNTTSYQLYQCIIPDMVAKQENIIIKIEVSIGPGSGTAAQFIMDDFSIKSDPSFPRPYQAKYRDIIINEIMARPSPTIGLPDAQYVEIFNRSQENINLAGFTLSDENRTAILPDYEIPAQSYVLLTSRTRMEHFEGRDNIIGLTNFPSLRMAGDKITFCNNANDTIDMVHYDISWYRDQKKELGGWSLELINPYNECSFYNNWKASNHPHGGTPGLQNSVYNTSPHKDLPKITSWEILNHDQLKISFSLPMNEDILNTRNISIQPHIKLNSIQSGNTYQDEILIRLQSNITEGQIYTLTFQHLTSCEGEVQTNQSINFGKGKKPDFNEIIITEIMANPKPEGALPESQYVEIFNTSPYLLSLEGLVFSDSRTQTTIPDASLQPGEYIILCPRTRQDLFLPFGKVIGLTNWPSLNLTRDILTIWLKENPIFSIEYFNSWYRNSKKKNGGWSLEMIDTQTPCIEAPNWIASEDPRGGTPGSPNSVKGSKPDLRGPKLVQAIALDSITVILYFDKKLYPREFIHTDFIINNDIQVKKIQLVHPQKKQIILTLNQPLYPSQKHQIKARNLTDCSGNLILSTHQITSLVLPEPADSLDILINEILSNPRPGGVRFIEIYNNSQKYINLNNWKLANTDTQGKPSSFREITAEDHILEPKGFRAITTDAGILKAEYTKGKEKNFIEVPRLPSYPIAQGTVILLNEQNQIIDLAPYHEDMHFQAIHNPRGVSLERISYTNSALEKQNWKSASSTSGYATPGYKNSQKIDLTFEGTLAISPKMFSPDNTGFNDYTTIQYSFNEGGSIASVLIFDITGRLIKTIAQSHLLGTEGFFTWDGTDDNFQKVRRGNYIIFVDVFNQNGSRKTYKEKVTVGGRF
jgi:hypothetical protein